MHTEEYTLLYLCSYKTSTKLGCLTLNASKRFKISEKRIKELWAYYIATMVTVASVSRKFYIIIVATVGV